MRETRQAKDLQQITLTGVIALPNSLNSRENFPSLQQALSTGGINKNSSVNAIRHCQRLLNFLFYLRGEPELMVRADGKYSNTFRDKVRDIQGKLASNHTGVLDEDTYNRIKVATRALLDLKKTGDPSNTSSLEKTSQKVLNENLVLSMMTVGRTSEILDYQFRINKLIKALNKDFGQTKGIISEIPTTGIYSKEMRNSIRQIQQKIRVVPATGDAEYTIDWSASKLTNGRIGKEFETLLSVAEAVYLPSQTNAKRAKNALMITGDTIKQENLGAATEIILNKTSIQGLNSAAEKLLKIRYYMQNPEYPKSEEIFKSSIIGGISIDIKKAGLFTNVRAETHKRTNKIIDIMDFNLVAYEMDMSNFQAMPLEYKSEIYQFFQSLQRYGSPFLDRNYPTDFSELNKTLSRIIKEIENTKVIEDFKKMP